MNKQELTKLQSCAFKVNICCEGCKKQVKKPLQKIDGVYTVSIDGEQGKVTVTGMVDPAVIIKKLAKIGKHAEIWGGGQKVPNYNQVQLSSQFKSMPMPGNNGKGGKDNFTSQKGGKDQQKGGQQQHHQGQHPQQFQNQHHQQQMKGAKDMKVGPPKDQKSVKFSIPEDEFDDEFDDEYDSEFDDEYDSEFDDEYEEGEELGHGHGHQVPSKTMPMTMGNNALGPQGPYGKMMPMMGNGPGGMINMHAMGDKKLGGGGGGGANGGGGGGGKKGGVIDFPIQMKGKGENNEKKKGKDGKKDGGNSKGGDKKKGGKEKGKKEGKNGNGGGILGWLKRSTSIGRSGVSNKCGGDEECDGKKNNGKAKGGKKHDGGDHEFKKGQNGYHQIDVFNHGKDAKANKGGKETKEGKGGNGGDIYQMGQKGQMGQMPNNMGQRGPQMGQMGRGGENMGQMVQMGRGGDNMGQMGGYPMGQMGNVPAVQGLPAQAMMNGGGYYQGMGGMEGPPNPYAQQQQLLQQQQLQQQQLQQQQQQQQHQQQQQQQQYMAMMMNQQRSNGNDMYQPMMYARPNPGMNYMPHQQQPMPAGAGSDPYASYFSDENVNGCSIM